MIEHKKEGAKSMNSKNLQCHSVHSYEPEPFKSKISLLRFFLSLHFYTYSLWGRRPLHPMPGVEDPKDGTFTG